MKDEKKDNPAADKSFSFALRIVKLYQHLSEYWLRLLNVSKFITERQFNSIYSDCSELIRISDSTQLTMRRKLQKGNRT